MTHEFGIAAAADAYRLIDDATEPYLAIRLHYPGSADQVRHVQVHPAVPAPAGRRAQDAGIGLIGAGAFATGTLLPALHAAGFSRLTAVASGQRADARPARRWTACTFSRRPWRRAAEVIADPGRRGRGDCHAARQSRGSHRACPGRPSRHVWCEKLSVALTEDELDAVHAAWLESGRILAIGFNRRWSPAVLSARQALARVAGPRLLVYRVAAGPVAAGHWYHDPRQGGRLLGEACHFVDAAQAALVGAPVEDVETAVRRQARVRPRRRRAIVAALCRRVTGQYQPTAARSPSVGKGESSCTPSGRTGW